MPKVEEQGPRDQLLEAFEWLEHLPKDPDVEPHPLAAANRDQSGVDPGPRRRRAGPERLGELGFEFGRNLLIGLISAEISGRVARLTGAGQCDLLYPLPVDQ